MDDKTFLKIAVEQAKESVEQGGFPAGAIVVKDREIITKGISIGSIIHDPTSHSETASIREACHKFQTTDLNGAILYASLEPCLMCSSVAYWSGIKKIIFACKKTDEMAAKGYYEGKNSVAEINLKNNRQIEMEHIPGYEQEMFDLIKSWEKT